MLSAAALIVLTMAATSAGAPPHFQADDSGRATDGQVVKDGARPRVQRIAILPDRTTGRAWGIPYLLAAVEDLNIVRPDAVFTVGDMVQGYTRSTSVWNTEADEYLGAVGKLSAAFYPTAGNHDVISGTRTAGDATFAEQYRQRFGPVWYSVELDLATVLVVFSDEGLGDSKMGFSDAQIAWLSGALQSASKRNQPIFLLMHRPMWRYPSVKWNDRVQPLLEKAGVDAVIAGHFHALQREADVGGVQYHIVGTCGGMIDQHPLAGQMQHLTFVDCTSEGALRVWHQPVGLVLPEDFVTRADQDRVYALRDPVPAVRTDGKLPDPSALTAPTEAVARFVVKNPLDVPIHVTLDPPGVLRNANGPAVWWTAGRAGQGTPGTTGGANGWTSHTLADVDYASTMATNARSMLRVASGACEYDVPAKSEVTIEVPVTLMPQSGTILAPQLDMYATFVDSKGRTVPIYLPTRLPIDRTVQLGTDVASAVSLPVLAWNYSPYDTREENPTVQITRSSDGTKLIIDALVPDQLQAAAPSWSAPDAKRKNDPHADAIRVLIDSPALAAPLDFLVEPFTTGCTAPDGVTMKCETRAGTGWSAHMEVPLPASAGANASIQVGIADNDDTFHTQWRWLAPAAAAGRWRLAEPVARSK